ncbi:probable serine hydrolase [Lucilia cuprina]|uniref:probable serine hydrolase n=1 Tax=Lucilia cuprina TaxID=7375 RepID=UPI001F0553D1|nr:probable serine hydrolase [Lucilia cuprina]
MNSKIKNQELRIPVRSGYIAACWYGNRNERPIVAMHGWQDNAGSFALLAPKLSQHVAILAIDLPGHGRSSHFPTGLIYHTSDYVRVIKEIMTYYKWSKISLIGHSMSCAVIYHFAALFPELVDIIISIDVLHTRYFTLDQQINTLNFCIEKFLIDTERKVINQIPDVEPPNYTFAELENMIYKASERSVDVDKAKYILERNITLSKKDSNKYYLSRDGGIKYLLETYTEPKLTELMAKRMFNIKWLVLRAEHSYHLNEQQATTKRILEILKENNPNFIFNKIPGVKHHCHLTDVEKVEAYIVPFLKKYRQVEYLNYSEISKL